jgi:hypothetical protein
MPNAKGTPNARPGAAMPPIIPCDAATPLSRPSVRSVGALYR